MSNIKKSKRITVQIPEGTEIHKYLSKNNKLSKWKLLNTLVLHVPTSKEELAIKTYDNFITTMSELYPDKKKMFEMLRPLVIKHIIREDVAEDGRLSPLPDAYFEELKKI